MPGTGGAAIWFSKGIPGILPLRLGFSEFLLKLFPGNCHKASGEVFTPCSMITVSWSITDGKSFLSIRYPGKLQLKTDISLLPLCVVETEYY